MQKDHEQHQTGQIFNMSLATLSRIDSCLSQLNNPLVTAKVIIHTSIIKSLYMELYPFLDDEEKKEGDDMLKEIYSQYFDDNGEPRVYLRIGGKMAKFEFWIRQKLNDKGLLMAKADDPGLALGRT